MAIIEDFFSFSSMSEIDNIFASKGKAKALPPQSSPAVKLSKKKQKKQIIDAHSLPIDKDETTSSSGSSKKRRLPETVVDTSNDIPASFKRQKTSGAKKSKSNRDDKSQVDENNLTSFKDSRGSSGRAFSLHSR